MASLPPPVLPAPGDLLPSCLVQRILLMAGQAAKSSKEDKAAMQTLALVNREARLTISGLITRAAEVDMQQPLQECMEQLSKFPRHAVMRTLTLEVSEGVSTA